MSDNATLEQMADELRRAGYIVKPAAKTGYGPVECSVCGITPDWAKWYGVSIWGSNPDFFCQKHAEADKEFGRNSDSLHWSNMSEEYDRFRLRALRRQIGQLFRSLSELQSRLVSEPYDTHDCDAVDPQIFPRGFRETLADWGVEHGHVVKVTRGWMVHPSLDFPQSPANLPKGI